MNIPKARKLPSGSWRIQMRLNGESVSITEPTEKQCTKTAQLIKAEYLAGKRVKQNADAADKPAPVTLYQAIDRLIESKQNVLSPATIRNYRGIQNTRFQSSMSLPLEECDQEYWQNAVNAEAPTCSAKTLLNAWRFVAGAITQQTGQRFQIRLPQVVRREHEFLDPDQIETFVSAVHGKTYEIAALLALCSLRRSEIKALRWQDVDMKNRIVHIRGSMVYNENGVLTRLDTNKNTTSRRDVPMIPQLYDALQAAEKNKQDDPVVPLSYNAIFSGINRTCKNAGLPEVGIHGLRHSFASLAYHLGMPEKIAMQIGGWSDNQTMHKIYTHVAQADLLSAQNAMLSYYDKMLTKTLTD